MAPRIVHVSMGAQIDIKKKNNFCPTGVFDPDGFRKAQPNLATLVGLAKKTFSFTPTVNPTNGGQIWLDAIGFCRPRLVWQGGSQIQPSD